MPHITFDKKNLRSSKTCMNLHSFTVRSSGKKWQRTSFVPQTTQVLFINGFLNANASRASKMFPTCFLCGHRTDFIDF